MKVQGPRPAEIRVLHLIGQLGHGGSERQLSLLLETLDREHIGSRLLVFNPSPHGDHRAAIEAAGCEVELLPTTVRSRAGRLLYLRRLCRTWKPSLLHSWTPHDNVYAGLIGRTHGIPSFGSLRGSLRRADVSLGRFERSAALRLPQRIVVNSRFLAAEVEEAGVSPERIHVLPNGVRLFHETTEGGEGLPQVPDTARVVGTIGNLRRVKNHELFLRGIAPLIRDSDDVWGVVVGQALPTEPGVEGSLRRLCSDLGIESRIVFTGFRDDARQLVKRFAALCLTSHSEGFPNVLLEAMAARVPVVATAVGGVPELVEDGVTGLLVESDDTRGFGVAVRRVLEDRGWVPEWWKPLTRESFEITIRSASPVGWQGGMPKPFELMTAAEAPRESLEAFLKDSFGDGKGGFLIRHGDWLHRGEENRLALVAGDEVVGYCGFIPTPILLDGRRRSAIWWMDLVIAPDYRGRGLQRHFDEAARSRSEFKLGFPNRTAALIHRRHGWGVHDGIDVSLAPLDGRAFSRLGRGSWVRGLAMRGLSLLAGPAMRRLRTKLTGSSPRARSLSGEGMVDSLAEIFERNPPPATTTLRDRDFLRWRYEGAPHAGQYRSFLSESGDLAVVLRLVPTDRGPVGRVVDLVGDLGDPGAVKDTLRAAMSFAAEGGAFEIKTLTSLPELLGPVRSSGFWLRTKGSFCWYSRGDAAMTDFGASRQHWVMADSDNDEPF